MAGGRRVGRIQNAKPGQPTLKSRAGRRHVWVTKEDPLFTPFEGGCRCRAVRYRCNAEPTLVLCCHCRDLQVRV